MFHFLFLRKVLTCNFFLIGFHCACLCVDDVFLTALGMFCVHVCSCNFLCSTIVSFFSFLLFELKLTPSPWSGITHLYYWVIGSEGVFLATIVFVCFVKPNVLSINIMCSLMCLCVIMCVCIDNEPTFWKA